MEVGEQHVDAAKPMPRVDEQPRLSLHRAEGPAGRGALQRPRGGGADAHHPPATRPGAGDGIAGRGGDFQPLPVQRVRLHGLVAERSEGARAHVQGHPRDLDALLLERREQRLVEVQAGGGRRDRARPARIHRLVSRGVRGVRLPANVRGKRHGAGALDEPSRVVRTRKLQIEQVAAPGPHREAAAPVDGQERAAPRLLAEPQPCEHPVGGEYALDEDLHPAAGRLRREQPGPDHPRVVDDDEISGGEVLGNPGKRPVRDARGRGIEDQQPAVAAPGSRMLRDQLRRQVVVEFGYAHGKRW